MKAIINKSKVFGQVRAIPSKSYVHRIAICNFLAGNQPKAYCGNFSSKDITATEECLKKLVLGENTLDCGESGSTLRFLLPLAAAKGGDYKFLGHGKLMERPNQALLEVLEGHGVKTEQSDGISISGKLESGEYKIRGDISSQYVSGLLMALPTLDGDSEIILTTALSSAPYVDITIEVLSGFGVNVEKTSSGFFVKGGQKFSGEVYPEGDWSNSAFFLALGALCGEITVSGLNQNSVQGDKAILSVLEKAGVRIEKQKDKITVRKSKILPFVLDGEDCPDIVPITAVIGAFSDGKSVIKNVERLKIKESDRILSTISLLSAFGVKAEYFGGDLTVYGKTPKAGVIDSFNDHRIVMAATVLAATCENESVIERAQAVEKSYPTFFEDFKSVGGRANV